MNVKEVNNNIIDSVDDTRHNLNDEHQNMMMNNVEQPNEIMLGGKKVIALCLKVTSATKHKKYC